jgi:hypothetical protein
VNIDFYLEYGGCFVHFGGQQDAGSSIYDYVKKVDMQARYDGLSDSKNFYRDSARSAPNNVICKFQQIYDDVNWDETTAKCPLTFSETDYTTGEEAATQFEIAYRESYTPSYTYDAETGLYKDIATYTLADGVTPFDVKYPLWSDGAEKSRWVWLPPCTSIDKTNADWWSYPKGTKAWKEFRRDGKRGPFASRPLVGHGPDHGGDAREVHHIGQLKANLDVRVGAWH